MPVALTMSRSILKVLIGLNIVFFGLFLLILAASFIGEDEVLGNLARAGHDPARTLAGVRGVMALGLAAVPLAHIILTRLLAIVETVRDGDPFVAGNAARLGVIAWALLGLQLLDLAFGAIALTLFPSDGLAAWTFSLTGWLAVLLLFVLARVFEHGSRLRDDLEGTV